MKKINRIKAALAVLYCFGIALFLNGCSNNVTPPDCGCESETRTTIPESAKWVGRLEFKSNDSVDPYYTDHYWITVTDWNCSGCVVVHLIICNDEILESQFEDVVNLPEGEFVEVIFSGDLKELCQKKNDIALISYQQIKLTSIERL